MPSEAADRFTSQVPAPRTRVVVPVVAAPPALDEQVRAARGAGADLVELRVDRIGDAQLVRDYLRARQSAPPSQRIPLLVTVRAAGEGGDWSGTESQRRDLLRELALLAPDAWHDVELASLASAQRTGPGSGTFAGIDPARLVASCHDFSGTPEHLAGIFERLAATGAAALKAVFTARDARDALRVLAAMRPFAARRPTIGLAMGEAGLLTRVLAGKFGAFATFASIGAASASAPGQPTLDELLNVYRWTEIGPRTRVLGVIGWPVTHSRSPHIHNAAMRVAGIDAVMVPLPVAPSHAELADFLDAVAAADWLDVRGLAVTVPHKEGALRWLRERGHAVGQLAERCGAVNTLVREPDGTWEGLNTDGLGAVRALQDAGAFAERPADETAVALLGAGGAARGVAAALLEHGCTVTVFNRTADRARRLADALDCDCRAWDQRAGSGAHVIINCTRVGMTPDIDGTPLDPQFLRPDQIVLDTVYTPPVTAFLRGAAARGCRTISGVDMFLEQAAAQFRRWHGRDPDRAAFVAALGSAR